MLDSSWQVCWTKVRAPTCPLHLKRWLATHFSLLLFRVNEVPIPTSRYRYDSLQDCLPLVQPRCARPVALLARVLSEWALPDFQSQNLGNIRADVEFFYSGRCMFTRRTRAYWYYHAQIQSLPRLLDAVCGISWTPLIHLEMIFPARWGRLGDREGPSIFGA